MECNKCSLDFESKYVLKSKVYTNDIFVSGITLNSSVYLIVNLNAHLSSPHSFLSEGVGGDVHYGLGKELEM